MPHAKGTDHDRLFKQLIRTYAVDLLRDYLPKLWEQIDPDSISFLSQEIFTNLAGGERHEVDLLLRVKLKGDAGFVLIHFENQARAQKRFPQRLLFYCVHLLELHDLPVYPIAIFTYDAPQRAEPDGYRMGFSDLKVLDFKYRVIQLNRMDWRKVLNRPSPITAALMAKMKIAPKDRPRVKLECLRMIARLKLKPADSSFIWTFVSTYLNLTAQEQKEYEAKVRTLEKPERKQVMKMVNDYEQKGIRIGLKRGRQEGRQEEAFTIALAMLERQFGSAPARLKGQIEKMELEALRELAMALPGLKSIEAVRKWMNAR